MEQRTSRRSNFELIRIFAMLMIIGAHLACHGGIFFYLIGGFIRKFDLITKAKNKKAGLLSAVVLTWVVYTFVTYLGDLRRTDDAMISKLFAKSTSAVDALILIPIAAIAFFLLLGGWDVKQNKWINKIASTTFGVYLIHDSLYGRSVIWRGILKVDTFWYNTVWFPLAAICFIAIVFTVCSLIDLLRQRLVEPFMLRKVEEVKARVLPQITE